MELERLPKPGVWRSPAEMLVALAFMGAAFIVMFAMFFFLLVALAIRMGRIAPFGSN